VNTDTAYISITLSDEFRIRTLRESMLNHIDGEKLYKRLKPHITLIPPFQLRQGTQAKAQKAVNSLDLEGTVVRVRGASIWNSLKQPYVVMLDIDADIESSQDKLLTELRNLNAKNAEKPVRPHITLFKTKSYWDTLPDTKRAKLQTAVKRNRIVQDTEVESVELIT